MDDDSPREIDSAFASPTFKKDGSFEVDKPVGSMSISPCGRDAVLASRQGLHIIDLDSPWQPPRHLPHHTPWEVADVQWSPFPARDHWVVSTANQRALVWNLGVANPRAAVEHYLHAHTRAITDINFSAHHPDVLATCAVDSFVHCWDLRAPRRPAVSFADWFGGATQVKWNRQDEHVIASSHDRFLRVWDDRKGARPLCSIDAHATKVYGIDWNRTRATAIVTCSLDRTIKFWDYGASLTEPERTLHTPYPVWRARHTPFGRGLLAMPQRGDNNLHLYNRCSGPEPYETEIFEGHQDQVKEFLWRFRGGIDNGIDNRDFQLVTWGADRFLRLHHLNEKMLAGVDYEKGKPKDEKYNLTRKNAIYRTFRDPSKVTATESPRSGLNGLLSSGAPDGMASTLSSSSSFAIGGWMTSGYLNARHGFRARDQARQELDPISWMKGVKIGKKEAPLQESTGSIVPPHSRMDKTWEDFDSLGEEITHVGSKFSKVQFRDVDVQNRYVKLSMHGLWGSHETSVYLNCRFDFPRSYPNGAAPTLSIEKTAQLDDAAISRCQAGVKEITDAYLDFQRSSLEALVRYLQGDQTINEALAWTRVRESSVIDFGADAGSSSEEEDELGDLTEPQADDFGLTATDPRTLFNANAHVPLPKGCGAVWAKDGHLVCFFPPREEAPSSLSGSIGFDGSAILPRGRAKYFEGFGKIHRYPTLKSKDSSLGTMESSDSDTDSSTSDSRSSSSRSSTSSRNASSREHHQSVKHGLRFDYPPFPRLDGFSDDSLGSNASASIAKSGSKAPKSLVSIHNLESLLPAKKSLADRYQITGPAACNHNAEVALDGGYSDLAETWQLLDLLTQSAVPLERSHLDGKGGQPPEYTIYSRLRRQDSGIGLSQQFEGGAEACSVYGQVKWGQHPFGDGEIVPELFRFYTLFGDVQMLAMMSCVLASVGTDLQSRKKPRTHRLDGRIVKSSSSMGQNSLSSIGTHTTRDYYPSPEVAVSLRPGDQTSRSSAGSPVKLRLDPHSQSSSFGAGNSDSSTQIAKSLTPPNFFKSSQRSADAASLISSSPERVRQVQRSSSNLASTFAASLPRPFSFNTSASSSPPNPTFVKRRVSPVGSLVAQTMVREASRSLEKSYEDSAAPLNDASRKTNDKSIITINLKNQDLFPLDGYYSCPLLDPAAEAQYQRIRAAYANLLAAWGLPLARAEMLRLNDRPVSHARQASKSTLDLTPDAPDPAFSINKRTTPTRAAALAPASGAALALVTHCQTCDAAQPPGVAASRCASCHARPRCLRCFLCAEPVRGLAAPCLTCGHVVHPACQILLEQDRAATASGDDGDDDNDDGWGRGACITGCSCRCADARPSVGGLAPGEASLVGPSTVYGGDDGGGDGGVLDGGAEKGEDEGPREDVAYESLAKNLGVGVGSGSLRRARATNGGVGGTVRGRGCARGRE